MKRIIACLLILCLANHILGQTNTFPPTGSVGIGILSPTESLHVNAGDNHGIRISSSVNVPILDLYQTGLNNSAARNWRISTNYEAWGMLDLKVSTAYDNSPSTSVFNISKQGNLTLPAGTLTVAGTGNSSIAGNMGIGTTSPGASLDIRTDNTKDAFNAYDRNGSLAIAIDKYGTLITSSGLIGSNSIGTDLIFTNGGTEALRLKGGNVGIGTTSPSQILEVEKDQDAATFMNIKNASSSTSGYVGVNANAQNQTISLVATSDGFARSYPGFHTSATSIIGSAANGLNIISNAGNGSTGSNTGMIRFITYAASGGITSSVIGNDAFTRMVIDGSGNVGVGTMSPSEKFSVNGNISTKKLIVTQTGWSDYVFNKDYKLRTLQQIETFIKANKHLPEIPSAKEVEEKGISVGDNQALLLKKIEELTLYLIEVNKKLARQNDKIIQLEHKLSKNRKKITATNH